MGHPAWSTDSQQIFVYDPNPTGMVIYRVDLTSGARELWQTIKPRDQTGMRPTSNPIAITPDGRNIVFTYSTQLGQLYRSDTLR
jgi:Tol biopolymer transport system component